MPRTKKEKAKGIFEQFRDTSLDELLTHLIANEDGVRPEDVTDTYIREQREKRIYPTVRYEIGSEYGGYSGVGLQFLSREELDAIEQRSAEKK